MAPPPPSSFVYPFLARPGNPDPLPRRSPSATSLPRPPSRHPALRAPNSRPASLSSWVPPILPNSFPDIPEPPRPAPRPSTLAPKLPHNVSLPGFPPPPRARLANLLTLLGILVGTAAAALLCWQGLRDAHARTLSASSLCLVLDDSFDSIDAAHWARDVQLGPAQFEMTTADDRNIFIRNKQLYIFPTLTADAVPGIDQDGAVYNLEGCTATVPSPSTTNSTNTNATSTDLSPRQAPHPHPHPSNTANTTTTTTPPNPAPTTAAPVANSCGAVTNYALGTVINPVQSGRISTKGKVSIKFGRVEVTAKLPRGDWLWPAIWMLPENNTYGPGPLSGEIDILEARGNAPSYPAQGVNYARSSLNYGLDKGLLPIIQPGSNSNTQGNPLLKQIYGWLGLKRTTFADNFHTYAVEWDDRFVRFYIDSRVRSALEIDIRKSKNNKKSTADSNSGFFWDHAQFPATAQNATDGQVVVIKDPWEGRGSAAPFDQRFYLIINLAVGGKTGWFPDEVGDKPWYDGSATAMRDFAKAQDQWYPTWPKSEDDRALRISSVKMWSQEC